MNGGYAVGQDRCASPFAGRGAQNAQVRMRGLSVVATSASIQIGGTGLSFGSAHCLRQPDRAPVIRRSTGRERSADLASCELAI
jgi:hypothetical protein